MDAPDSNAYATGTQAASVNARAAFEEHDVDHARKRREFAAGALLAAKQRLQELEAAHKLGQKAFDEAAQYDQLAARQLEASLARLAKVRAPLHPVRKTPLEILGLIFECCLDPLPATSLLSEKPVDVLRRQRQPFQLAAVCRRWRSASLFYPKSWSCIELRLDDIQKSHVKYWAGYISWMLSRSASTPLHLRMFRSRFDKRWDQRLIAPLSAEMHRCESLLLSIGGVRDDLDSLISLLMTPTPALRTLHFLLPTEEEPAELPNILAHAPRLTRVRTSFPFAYGQTLLPAVTFVALYEPLVCDMVDFLENALSVFPNVDEVSLIDLVSYKAETAEKVVCNASKLRMQTSISTDGDTFADRFVFPRLDYLFVYGPENGSAARVDLVHALLYEAVPQLTRLTFGSIADRDIESFVQGLQAAGKLTKLSLVRSRVEPEGLRQLCHAFGRPWDDGSWLCPSLTILSLYDCTFSDDSPMESLVELVERRNLAAAMTERPRRPRRLVQLCLPAAVDDTITSRIDALL